MFGKRKRQLFIERTQHSSPHSPYRGLPFKKGAIGQKKGSGTVATRERQGSKTLHSVQNLTGLDILCN
jgi:hypothetical protein